MPFEPIQLPTGVPDCDWPQHGPPATPVKVPSWWICPQCGDRAIVLPPNLTDPEVAGLLRAAVRVLIRMGGFDGVVGVTAFYAGLGVAVVERLVAPAGSGG